MVLTEIENVLSEEFLWFQPLTLYNLFLTGYFRFFSVMILVVAILQLCTCESVASNKTNLRLDTVGGAYSTQ